jgi:hypothetical protein
MTFVAYESEANDWWEDLSYEDKLKAFFVVTNKIYKGDLIEKGTYRYVLYDVFKFDCDSYIVGMDSGYLDVHNAIYTRDDILAAAKKLAPEGAYDFTSNDVY